MPSWGDPCTNSGLTVDLEDVLGSRAAHWLPAATRRRRPIDGCCRRTMGRGDPRTRGGDRPCRCLDGGSDARASRRGLDRQATRADGVVEDEVDHGLRRASGRESEAIRQDPRFTSALKLIHAGNASFAEIAAGTGYYDQPHLNAEFKELSGFTPRQFSSRIAMRTA